MKLLPHTAGLVSLCALLLVPLTAQQPGPLPSPKLEPGANMGPMPISAEVPSPSASPEELIGPINMPGDSVDATIALMERWTGKAILRPQNLPEASITLVLKDKVTKREAIQAVETLLNMNGIALTPLGTRFMKAVPLNLARSEAPEFIEGSTLELTPSGRLASKIFQLSFLRIDEFMPLLQGVLNQTMGGPILIQKSNAVLVTDSITNLQRVETLVTQLDQPLLAGLQPKFYPLSNVKASDLVNKLRTLFTGSLQAQLGSATTYTPDDRTNQIILMSDPRQHPFFDDLIAKLDVASESNTRNEVISLKHAAAKDVQAVLQGLITGQNTTAKATGQEVISRPGQQQPAAPMPTPSAGPVPMPQISMASLGMSSTEGSNQFSSNVTIIAEERTNSIVVSGNLDDIRLIQSLVDKLDTILAQVRIEIVAVEVRLTDGASSGIDSLGLRVEGGRLTGAIGSTTGLNVTGIPTTATTPGNTGASPDYATLVGGLNSILSITTTPRKDNTTILSVPTITTTHNKEAKIFVGETRPTITGSTTSTATSGTNPYQTSSITQAEIGLTITVKPLIGPDGSVQLDLKQEISEAGPEVKIDQNVQNIILKRNTSQFITAKSGEILVLGGLQKKSNTHTTSRLGPIPFLGDLFGRRSRTEVRNELIFFLRPTVLTNTPVDNAAAYSEVDKLPEKKHREAIKKALGTQPSP